jgi:hypothetical protein
VLTLLNFNDFSISPGTGRHLHIAMHERQVHIDLGVIEQNNGNTLSPDMWKNHSAIPREYGYLYF